jgi:hypothetical protein
MTDEYSDWDASYVLGVLSATERREFERHLASCDDCSAGVAELAGIPGLLAKVASDEATMLHTTSAIPLPSTLLPRLVRSARRRQRRVRGFVAGGIAAATVAAAAVVLVVTGAVAPGIVTQTSAANARLLSLSQVIPNPLSASIRLTQEGWGTRIEMDCHYAPPITGQPTPYVPQRGDAASYAMFVTDAAGNTTQVATWTAGPGSDVEPSGTTSLAVAEIKKIDVRSTSTGAVLLEGKL